MTENYYGATDKGRVRQNNEDTFFVQPVLGGAFLAACVIDGVGGYEGGEEAARIAQAVLLQYLSVPSGDVPTMMLEAMIAANDAIVAARKKNLQLSDMACVATLALTDEEANIFYYTHIGDTRLYLYRDGTLVKVTKDQSFVGFLEDNGRLTETEAMHHLKRNEIDKALGFDAQIRTQKDYFDSGSSPFLPGDLLLLCSDGLTDLVPSAAIGEILETKSSLAQKTKALIQTANNAGGKDNITVVLVQHSRSPQKQRAVKPKKKAAKTINDSPATSEPTAPPPQNAPRKRAKKKALLPFVALLALVIGGFIAWQYFKGQEAKHATLALSPEAGLLIKQVESATDSLVLSPALGTPPVLLNDTLQVLQDSLVVQGNGLHLAADSLYKGAGIALAASSRYLLLRDMVLENFEVGILAKGQTVQLKNVQFINCAVPVQYGFTVPVNTPVNLLIKDSIFTQADTTVLK